MTQTIDIEKVEQFAGHVLTEAGAAFNAGLVVIGDRLGLYRAMADGNPVTAADLAARTGTGARVKRSTAPW